MKKVTIEKNHLLSIKFRIFNLNPQSVFLIFFFLYLRIGNCALAQKCYLPKSNSFPSVYISKNEETIWGEKEQFYSASQNEHFVENLGQIKHLGTSQIADSVLFGFKRGDLQVFIFKNTGLVWQINKVHYPQGFFDLYSEVKSEISKFDSLQKSISELKFESYRMDMFLVGANQNCTIEKKFKSKDFLNFLDDSIMNVHSYQEITFKDIYPGIDWVISSEKEGVKQNFIVHPGADPSNIKMQYSFQDEIFIDSIGNLIQINNLGRIIENSPISYQEEKMINTFFIIDDYNEVTFQLDHYNNEQLLIIDPLTRIWGTFFGGSTGGYVFGNGCTTDNNGNVFLSGSHLNVSGLGTPGVFQSNLTSLNGVGHFISKFDNMGNRIWSSYLGTSSPAGNSFSFRSATDLNGNVYVSGHTNGAFIMAVGGHQSTYFGGGDGFVIKISANGGFLWGTYYGGDGVERITDIKVDLNNNVVIVGYTDSDYNIATFGTFKSSSYIQGTTFTDVFVAKFNSNGTRLWGTYLGGTDNDYGGSCDINSTGDIFISGVTRSFDFSVLNAYQYTIIGYDAFLTKMSASGNNLLWSTYYGGNFNEGGPADISLCSVDDQGNVYLAGITNSTLNIATVGAFQTTLSGLNDLYLVKFSGNGIRLWSTYKGVSNHFEQVKGIKTYNNDWVVLYGKVTIGSGSSNGFTTNNAYQLIENSPEEAFLCVFDNNGIQQETTYFGGSGIEYPTDLSIDDLGAVYIVGSTNSINSPNMISTNGAFQQSNYGPTNAYLVKFDEIIGLNAELGDFYFECKGDNLWLKWFTHSESNCDFFVIDESFDGLNFKEYTKIKANGNISSFQEYELPVSNKIEDRYFILKQVDYDGDVDTLRILHVSNCLNESAFIVFPNPINEDFLSVYNPGEIPIVLNIISSEGKNVYYEEKLTGDQLFKIPIRSFANGYYFLKINDQVYPFTVCE